MSKNYIVAPGANYEMCIKQKLYGHTRNLLKRWEIGDRVFYYVDKKIAGIATVSGAPYFDDQKQVWPDALYPFRVEVTPDTVLPVADRIPVKGAVKETLVEHLGKYWILAIRDVHAVPPALAAYLQAMIERQPLKLQDVPVDDFKAIQKEAQKQVERKKAQPPPKGGKPAELSSQGLLGTSTEEQSHDRTQWYLIRLGRALGCDVWVAKNDRNKTFKGEVFADLCLSKMPNLGFDQDTSRIIENIDVIWLKGSVIQCAFEVEHTTSVYSGILRLADLVASQPNTAIKLFIVAPKDRKPKVVSELNRPVFRDQLCTHCKYIPYDKLEATLAKIEDFQGYLQVGLVEKIAETCNFKAKLFE
jgi:hypothetical protein